MDRLLTGSRVVLLLRGVERDAYVLGVVQDLASQDGDPALNLAYFDETKVLVLGTPDWPNVFTKLDAVKHMDHQDITDGKEIACWDFAYGETELLRSGNYLTRNFAKDIRPGDTHAGLISRLGDELKGWRAGTRKRYSDGSTAMVPDGSEPLPDTAPATRPAPTPVNAQPPDPSKAPAGSDGSNENRGLGHPTTADPDQVPPGDPEPAEEPITA